MLVMSFSTKCMKDGSGNKWFQTLLNRFLFHSSMNRLAEPLDELHKSYEQFLHRMEQRKNKRMQVDYNGHIVYQMSSFCLYEPLIDYRNMFCSARKEKIKYVLLVLKTSL